MNRVILIGYVGKEPRLIQTQKGELCTFPVAERSYKDEKTAWHRVTLCGDLALVAKAKILRGDELYVEGRLVSSNWVDKTGTKHRSYEVRCDRFERILKFDEPNDCSCVQSLEELSESIDSKNF